MKKQHRFTLVELLAVVAIIAILSAIGFGSYSYAMGKAKESSTRALLKQLEAGLESFNTKHGHYPPSGVGFNTMTITIANGVINSINFGGMTLTYTASPANRADRLHNEMLGTFTKATDVEVLKKHLNASGEIEDAWGGKIYYCAPGTFNIAKFDLISAGPDGKFSSGNAAAPTGVSDRTKYRTAAGEAVCDDIFNF